MSASLETLHSFQSAAPCMVHKYVACTVECTGPELWLLWLGGELGWVNAAVAHETRRPSFAWLLAGSFAKYLAQMSTSSLALEKIDGVTEDVDEAA